MFATALHTTAEFGLALYVGLLQMVVSRHPGSTEFPLVRDDGGRIVRHNATPSTLILGSFLALLAPVALVALIAISGTTILVEPSRCHPRFAGVLAIKCWYH